MPQLHVVAGPNGVGKTTLFKELVPDGVDYINADLIARTLREMAKGVNTQELANSEAAKLFYEKVASRRSFSIETNLVDVQTYKSFEGIQKLGYEIIVTFLCIDDPEKCVNRVKQRVLQGGHNVNADVIRARHSIGLQLLSHYKSMPDRLTLVDNLTGDFVVQAVLEKGIVLEKVENVANWAKSILDQQDKAREVNPATIDEVRKLYERKKKGRSI